MQLGRPWVIADFHYNHAEAMVKEIYCSRPLDYESRLYNSTHKLNKNDMLICLGDICIGKDEWVHEVYIQTLDCKKILVKGNHDPHTNSWYLRHGWDFVCTTFTDSYYGKKILFSHEPQPWDGNFDFNIFGHMHNNLRRKNISEKNKEILSDRHILIAVEYTNYRPINLNHLIAKSEKFKVFNQIKD